MSPTTEPNWRCGVASASDLSLADAGTVIVGLFHGFASGHSGRQTELRELLGVDVGAVAALDPTFSGRALELAHGTIESEGGPTRLVILGLGDQAEFGAEVIRSASAVAGRAIGATTHSPAVSLLAWDLPTADGVAAALEGHLLGAWAYSRPGPRGVETDRLLTVAVPESRAGTKPGADQSVVARSVLIARVTNWVRQLVETPPNLLGPEQFADAVQALASELAPDAVTVTRWDADELAARGFGGTVGVGSGSSRPPLVIELSAGHGDPIALAGKGITFDSGGINLKRSASELAWMKSDMAAAASIAAAVVASAALGSGRALHAILPVAENMPGTGAQRPGDVVSHPGGRTTEISDTDSEGRLVLADAIAWLALTAPAAIIDVGTLTDSGALGTEFWGCWTTAPALAAQLVDAGGRVGDRGWVLPLHPTYSALLASRVADTVNAPLDSPDTGQMAATYLRGFAGNVPWVHIDTGAGAWLERDAGAWAAGATGTPVRALIEYLAPRE